MTLETVVFFKVIKVLAVILSQFPTTFTVRGENKDNEALSTLHGISLDKI